MVSTIIVTITTDINSTSELINDEIGNINYITTINKSVPYFSKCVKCKSIVTYQLITSLKILNIISYKLKNIYIPSHSTAID
jgi:hypothetical protein